MAASTIHSSAPAGRWQCVSRGFGDDVDRRADGRRAVYFQAMQDDAAANPDHGGCADGAENCQEHGHPANKGASEREARRFRAVQERSTIFSHSWSGD
jgi:hypothetical protein